jgi:DNA-binding transcriptional ArsR family regulator
MWRYYVRFMHATTLGALGEPSRFQIVELLRSGPRSVGEIVDALGIRQPQVSKHLRVLSGAGIVAAEPLARQRIYHLQAEPFEEIRDWVDSFERAWEIRLDSLGMYLDSIKGEEDASHED